MRLIGMLDSPYVRRTAIGMACLHVPFTHEAVSVISTFEDFARINPVVKAPTLVCEDGTVMMDSTLILQFIEATATQGRTLWPGDPRALQQDFRAVSLALAACEKAVQTLYESKLRPADKQHAPWLARVNRQLAAALHALNTDVGQRGATYGRDGSPQFNHASITAAVAWQFIHSVQPEVASPHTHRALQAHSTLMEATEPFRRLPPVGPGVQPPSA